MQKRKKLRQLGQLVTLQKHERERAETEVHLASHSHRRAEEIQLDAKTSRDDAALAWHANMIGEHYDFMVGQIRAQALLDCERNVDQSNALVRLAEDRLEDRRSIWRFSDLRVRASEKIEKSALRNFRRNLDETQLSDSGDRISFRSARRGN